MLRSWSEKFKRRPSDSPIVSRKGHASSTQQTHQVVKGHQAREEEEYDEDDRVATAEVEKIKLAIAHQLQQSSFDTSFSVTVVGDRRSSTATASTTSHHTTTMMPQSPTPTAIKTPYQELCDEICKESTDSRRLKNLLNSSLFRGQVPSELRFAIWKRLLEVAEDLEEDARLSEEIQTSPRDLPNQRVIRVDVERTRVDLPEFRESATQEFLTQSLTYFCKTRKCRYKQGLNEILAPFVYLLTQRRADEPDLFCKQGMEGLVYRMWTTFMDRFIPHLYDDDRPAEGEEMITLQCSFRFFELLLLYHDPELWHLLDHNKLKPELYASPWLMTMFAQNVPMFQAFQLWETMLLGEGSLGDAFVVLFVALAFLCSNRNTFLGADPSDLPVLLTSRLSYHRRTGQSLAPAVGTVFFPSASSAMSSPDANNLVLLSETLKHAINIGIELRKHTPDLLLWDIRTALHIKAVPPTSRMLARLTTRVCATCSAEFFWMGIGGRLEDSTEIIVIDCRPRKEFEQKRARARLVFNFGAEILEHPERLQASLADLRRHVLSESAQSPKTSNVPSSLAKTWRWHICVVGTVCRSLFDGDSSASGSPATSAHSLPRETRSSATISPPSTPGTTLVYPPAGPTPNAIDPKDLDGVSGMCILHLLKHSFPCVCVVEGGWDRLLKACPDPERLLFPAPVVPHVSMKGDQPPSSVASQPSVTPPLATAAKKSHPAYRRPRASYGDAVEDFDGPSFIVSRSSRGAPIKF